MNRSKDRKSIFTMWTALLVAMVFAMCVATPRLQGQDKKPYRAGTIVDVKPHQGGQAAEDAAKKGNGEPQQYDLSIKVDGKVYVVLYTPPPGQNFPELAVGMDRTVLVDGDTMKINDLLGRTHTMPILSSKDAPEKATN